MKSIRLGDRGKQVPVGKILCLGRNYPEHAKEMNAEVPQDPIVFIKPSTALLQSGGTLAFPPFSRVMHHEVEMVVLMGRDGKNIAKDAAYDFVAGYGVGLDMTLRDIQSQAKKNGLPWSVSKGFDSSAPVSVFVEKGRVSSPQNLEITLKVNGQVRQHSNTGRMLFPIDRIIEYISSVFTLEQGDLIFTGTPEGVGPVVSGDVLEAGLEGVGTLTVNIG